MPTTLFSGNVVVNELGGGVPDMSFESNSPQLDENQKNNVTSKQANHRSTFGG